MNIYDREGKPITMDEWAELHSNPDYQSLHKTRLHVPGRENEILISTVWLGLDHSFGECAPLIFETMVFDDPTFTDRDMDRYSTEEEAHKGHVAMVNKVKEKYILKQEGVI